MSEGHFLVVSLGDREAVVYVLTASEDGSLHPLIAETPEGKRFETPIVIRRGE